MAATTPRKSPAYRRCPAAEQRGGWGSIIEQIKRNRTDGFGTIDNSYSHSSPVYACVRAKADAFGMLPLMVSTGDDKIIESGPLCDLAERPNPKMTGRQFRRHTSAHLDLFGRVHWWLHLDAGGRPMEVFVLNPMQVTAKTNRHTGELLAWEYRPGGRFGQYTIDLPLDEVHTIIDPDFEDDADPILGMSPRRAVTMAIEQYYKADVANSASLDNGVEPGMVLSFPQDMGQDQLRDLRETLIENLSGTHRRRIPLVMFGGGTMDTVPISYSDMEFTELKKMSRTDICAAFSVPPAVIGYYDDSNYAHADAAEQAFWIKTILPRAAWLAEEWTLGVLDRFGGDRSLSITDARQVEPSEAQAISYGHRRAFKATANRRRSYYGWFDDSGVPAVQKARLASVDQAMKWNSIGVPVADIIEATDAPFPVRDWMRTWYKPFGLVDVREEASLPGMSDPPGSEDPTDPENVEASMRQLPGVDQRSEQTRARLWLQWRQSWAGLERAMKSKTKRHFNGLRSETLERLAATIGEGGRSISGGDRRRDLIGEILFDIIAANEKLLKVVGPIFRDSYRLGGEQVASEAPEGEGDGSGGGTSGGGGFNMADPNVSAALRRREIQITGLNRTLSRRLRQRIDDGLTEGATLDQLKDTIREEFNIAGRRAATIARTEVGAAVEEARAIGMRQAGVPLKSWLSSRKETGRPSHLATELETMRSPVPRDQDFRIGTTGVTCPHPRATGRPEHDINCTCTSVARFEGDSVRSVLERYMRKGFLTYEQLKARDGSRADDQND